MVQITVEDILGALDEANVKLGRLQLQRDGLLREIVDLSRRIEQLTPEKGKDKKETKDK
jgi:hypothetical protein